MSISRRLVIRFVDYAQSEMELITLLDAIPDAIDRDPRLGARLAGGIARCSDGITGFAEIGGVTYRIVDYHDPRVRETRGHMSDQPMARYYDASKNADGVYLPGVPLSDIDEERWASYPDVVTRKRRRDRLV